MIYSVKGRLVSRHANFFVLDIGPMSLKIGSSINTIKGLPLSGESVNVFTHLHVREDALELYGFLNEEELRFFEMLIGISGIGPKSALGILGIDKLDRLKAAISEGRPELLTKASGVGRKTADRIILELKSKLSQEGSAELVGVMQSDHDIVEALMNLGYSKQQIKEALSRVDPKITEVEKRIKAALKIIKPS